MKRIIIYGLGEGKKILDRCLATSKVEIVAYIDNYKSKERPLYGDGKRIIGVKEIGDEEFDAIVISIRQYTTIKTDLYGMGVSKEKIICLYSFEDANNPDNWEVLDESKWRNELVWWHYSRIVMPCIANYHYELYAEELEQSEKLPLIQPIEKTICQIKEGRKNLSRFGDAEFEIIFGRKRERVEYENPNKEMSRKLKIVLHSDLDNLLIAIANNYGSLSKYTPDAANAIRLYLGKENTRKEHMDLLDLKRVYHDAYISRPYILLQDKEGAGRRFDDIKSIWENQDVLIVEGLHTRFGVGNDLLQGAKAVSRILTLDRNCFDVYDKLLQTVIDNSKGKLVLLCLGAVATIMAYDLSLENIWAIDIGQIDIEYEWYLRRAKARINIPYKTTSEASWSSLIEDIPNECDKKRYMDEIIEIVNKS